MKHNHVEFDERNIGGQKQLTDLMSNHMRALGEVKPTINTREKPRPHVDHGRKRPIDSLMD